MKPELCRDGHTIRVHVPMTFQRRGGRKLIIAPNGLDDWIPPQPKQDDTLSKALARILRLTLLAPDIVEAILDGRQPKGLALADFMEPFPVEWEKQRERFEFTE